MADRSTDLVLPAACNSDLQSQMMLAEAHDEMEDSHWMASLRQVFSAWKELLWMPVGACYSWIRSS